ncbi:MAG: glutamate-1-semialdehyde 2,1-aminomutase [Actinomycetota bacterium]
MRVGVTREGAGARRLAELLTDVGVEPVVVPLIRTGPPADDGAALRRALAEASPGDWLVVTSPTGARAVLDAGPVPAGVLLAVVGPSTAASFAEAGLDADLVPERYDAAALAAELADREPGRALLALSELADDTVAAVLRATGWDVDRVDAYATVSVTPSAADRAALRSCEVITLASGSAARGLAAAEIRRPVVCLGAATAEMARELGLDVAATAETSTLDGLISAVLAVDGRQGAVSDTGRNAALHERALSLIPGGVNSPIRAFGAVGGSPYYVARAEGGRLWDEEGAEYLDLVQSYGAIILGHAHPASVAAIQEAATRGTSYGAPTEREILLAEAVRERVPTIDKLRLVNSGTEATMSAIRVARGATGRAKVVKFAGNYHGHGDFLLAAAGSALAANGLPASGGVPESVVADTAVAPFNVVPELDESVACVIVEPAAANMGLVPPVEGFLDGLRIECDRVGALLIFDEVITGFRLARGGAQELYGVVPDLSCFGKIIGGGLPIGAYGGRADLMDTLTPLGKVFQAGTLSGNPLATAAGLAVLDRLDQDFYDELADVADRMATGMQNAIASAGLDWLVSREATLLGLYCGATPPRDYDDALAADTEGYSRFFHSMLEHGVAMAPAAFEALFPSIAHDDADIERIVEATAAAAAAV